MISIDKINAILPQTQCGQCGYKGCKPYAEAIALGRADINQCPPGGDEGILELAKLLGLAAKPLHPEFGDHKPKQVAVIVEEDCIGCVKCIAACPVDAILGAAKLMHTVIAAECTGCELCVAPCPVDCIIMEPLTIQLSPEQKIAQKLTAMCRYEARNRRKDNEALEKAEKVRKQKEALLKMRLASGDDRSSV
ncbi:RnfABCDGE type electron transport complex subunit B [Methyloglobulus sp.]|uniref:RnfABCDGE type electron transport complex subunit B n=1 Tax=Methyloglobulus sp. TaxID=2518622 RepID=UPI003988B5F7